MATGQFKQGSHAIRAGIGALPARREPPKCTLVDATEEARVDEILRENISVINSIRDNLINGKFDANMRLMQRFRMNITGISTWLATLPVQVGAPMYSYVLCAMIVETHTIHPVLLFIMFSHSITFADATIARDCK